MAIPRQISLRWLAQKQTSLDCTEKVDRITKEPNPHYVREKASYDEAVAERARWDEFERWINKTLGLKLNAYPLKTPSGTYEENQVFMRKDKATGKTEFLTRAQAWEKFESREQSISCEEASK